MSLHGSLCLGNASDFLTGVWSNRRSDLGGHGHAGLPQMWMFGMGMPAVPEQDHTCGSWGREGELCMFPNGSRDLAVFQGPLLTYCLH